MSGKTPEEICVRLMEKYLEEKKSLSARVPESEAILTENEKNTADVDEFIRRLKSMQPLKNRRAKCVSN